MKNKYIKRAVDVAQCEGLEFNPQYFKQQQNVHF